MFMDFLDNLSQLPEWDEEGFNDNEEKDGESWKRKPLRNAAKALYNQWREVMAGIYALFAVAEKGIDTPEGFLEEQKRMVLSDAIQIAVKVKTSEGVDMYVLLMENAAVVRKNAIFIQTQINSMALMGIIEETHADAVKADIDAFRLLFITWVSTFKKDEYEDDWGFFV
jgi:hypothetical protein